MIQIILAPYQDPSCGLDWHEQTSAILEDLKQRLDSWENGSLVYELSETNHGLGADWPTITLSILSVAGTAFFAIPAAHKKIRESIEEWRRVKATLEKLLERLSPKQRVASFPVEMLFLDAVESALKATTLESLEFLSYTELPVAEESRCGSSCRKHYLFCFRATDHAILVAINNSRAILWSRKTPL